MLWNTLWTCCGIGYYGISPRRGSSELSPPSESLSVESENRPLRAFHWDRPLSDTGCREIIADGIVVGEISPAMKFHPEWTFSCYKIISLRCSIVTRWGCRLEQGHSTGNLHTTTGFCSSWLMILWWEGGGKAYQNIFTTDRTAFNEQDCSSHIHFHEQTSCFQ